MHSPNLDKFLLGHHRDQYETTVLHRRKAMIILLLRLLQTMEWHLYPTGIIKPCSQAEKTISTCAIVIAGKIRVELLSWITCEGAFTKEMLEPYQCDGGDRLHKTCNRTKWCCVSSSWTRTKMTRMGAVQTLWVPPSKCSKPWVVNSHD